MKTKSFTLIEILLATMIFTLVVMTAAVSFALIKRSNDRTSDLKTLNECARQVEDFVTTEVKSAKYGPRIMGLILIDDNEDVPSSSENAVTYYLKTAKPISASNPNPQNLFRGMILYKGQGQARAIFLYTDKYYYKDFSLSDAQIADGTPIQVPILEEGKIDATLIHSDACTTQGGLPDNVRPFYINQVQDISDPSNVTYEVVLDEAFCRFCNWTPGGGTGVNAAFRRLKRQSAANQIYSRIYTRVINNAKEVK